jgi:hypothetical protein
MLRCGRKPVEGGGIAATLHTAGAVALGGAALAQVAHRAAGQRFAANAPAARHHPYERSNA